VVDGEGVRDGEGILRKEKETLRMRWFNWSAKIKLLPSFTVTADGLYKLLLVPGPPSPLKPTMPFPTTVVMTPAAMRRIRWLSLSAMNTWPPPSTATPVG
jgi:hypothetical protein